MVDVAPEAAPLIDSRATARLVALETADVDVPPPPGASFRPPLYFRIRPLSAASLRVELWELGQPYGARSVSAVGSNTLKARRIALAAAELARQLRQRRLAELRAARHAPEEDQERATKRAGTPIYGRLGWGASARGASLGAADVWLLGPAIEATLHFSSGQRLSLGAAWLAGSAPVLGSSSARWLEASLSLAQGFSIAPSLELTAGLSTAIASLRLDQTSGSGSAGPLDTWSARAGALARVEGRLGRYVALGVGPDIGALLRPVTATGRDDDTHRVGGLWLGGTLTLLVDPAAP